MTRPGAHPHQYPRQLEVACQNGADGVSVSVRGEIDLASAPALERELRDAESAARRIVLDLAGLEFIDSTGLHVLIDAQQRAASNGHEFVLRHVPPHTRRLFRITGIDTRFTVE